MMNYVTDITRGMYVNLPSPVKRVFSPLLGLVPMDGKFGATYRQYKSDIARSQYDTEFVKQYRLEKLKQLLDDAAYRSPYYSRLSLSIDKDCADENLLLNSFPIVSKDVVRNQHDELLIVDRHRVDELSTSGSSGKPLIFYLDKDRSVKEWAFIHSIWEKTGYRNTDARAVLRGIQISNVDKQPWEYDSALKELRLSPFHMTQHNMTFFLQQIERRKIRYLHGYPSALLILSRAINNFGWDYRRNITGIFPISESLFNQQRNELNLTFPNATVQPFYGLSEKVAFAGEVIGEKNVYEFEPLYGITELADLDGSTVTEPGRTGRVISTGLLCRGMPLIRYDTEDEAELVERASHNNGYRLRVRKLHSRWSQEFVIGSGGELISMAAINIHSPVYGKLREFQFFQKKIGQVAIRMVPNSDCSKEELQRFVKEVQDKVGSSVEFTIEVVDEIKKNLRGKAKFIVQELNLADFQSGQYLP